MSGSYVKIGKGTKGADYASPQVSLPRLKKMGMTYVCRYIDGTAHTNNPTWKTLTKRERALIELVQRPVQAQFFGHVAAGGRGWWAKQGSNL